MESSRFKFRAWDKENEVMADIDFFSKSVIGIKNAEFEDIENFILLQFTGLHDKNGKEIYEGDIVEFNNCDYQRTAGHLDDEILRGKVIFSYGEYRIETDKGNYNLHMAIVNDEELEAIGNIYENPELLKEEVK